MQIYPSGSIGRDIAYIKYLDQKDLRGSKLGTNLSTVLIYHAIGKELGYDHCVTNEEYSNMEDKYDYETFRTITTKIPDADRVNMMMDMKAMDKLLDKYNDHAANAEEPKPTLKFDKLTMSTRPDAREYIPKDYDPLKPVSLDDPHIGDVKQYQNNIRSFINKGRK